MRRRILTLALAALAAFPLALGASAHAAPPCNDSGEPGHSDYARHHIAVLATAGELGHVHVPGSHQGYSLCLGVHP